MFANRDLLGAFHVIHAVVVIAGVDDVPMLHHLPAGGRAEDGIGDNFVGVIGAGWIEDELHIPDVILPNHDLEIVSIEVLVGFD